MENSENIITNPPNHHTLVNPVTLPNAGGILAMGIISIALCCTSIIGLALGVIALVLGNKAIKLYKENPDSYTEASFKNANAGRICAIIGICLSSLYFIYMIIVLSIYGMAGMYLLNFLGKGM